MLLSLKQYKEHGKANKEEVDQDEHGSTIDHTKRAVERTNLHGTFATNSSGRNN